MNKENDIDPNAIFVGSIPGHVQKEDLKNMFLFYGEILDFFVPKGKNFAFITYKTPQSALEAIKDMHGANIDGKKIRVTHARTSVEEKKQNIAIEEKLQKQAVTNDTRPLVDYSDLY